MRCIKLLLILVLLPTLAGAEGVLTPAANPSVNPLYNYRDQILLQDDFTSGTNSSGAIGQLGWLIGGGSTSNFASLANHFGIVRKDTSATSATTSWQILNGSASAWFPAYNTKVLFIFRINNSDANTTVRIGSGLGFNSATPTDGSYLEKLDADTNWFCVTIAAASGSTRTDTGIAAAASTWKTFQYESTASSVVFYLDGVPVCTHTTNLTALAIAPAFHIKNSAAASKTMDVDYFQGEVRGLGR